LSVKLLWSRILSVPLRNSLMMISATRLIFKCLNPIKEFVLRTNAMLSALTSLIKKRSKGNKRHAFVSSNLEQLASLLKNKIGNNCWGIRWAQLSPLLLRKLELTLNGEEIRLKHRTTACISFATYGCIYYGGYCRS